MAPKSKDPLIQREVVISAEATGKGGKPHAQAGQRGKVIGKTPGGRQYQIAVGDSLVNLPMDAFEVLQAEREGSADAGAIVHPTLPIAQIAPSRTNRRVIEDDALHDMAATMKLYGVLQPLLLRRLPAERLQDTFEDEATRRATHEIIAGERRYRAAQIAGLRTVPYIEREADNMHALLMQLIENLHRSDLTPLQEALGVQRLTLDHGFSIDGAAEALQKSRTHVFESLRLLTLCPEATAALAARTLTRSVALLVAQRPTEAIQTEYTKRVLTGGPDGGPMSYRSALDLARRSYMLKLDQAPFALDDATLCPSAGACSVCPKHTGASPELWDKSDADVCTDTACFAEKKDAHFERMKAQAQQRGQQIITGRQARDIMPSENGAPRGYLLLDKPSQGSSAPVRQVLGQDVPAASVVLIEAPSGNLVEAVATHTASAAVKVKGERQAAAKAQTKKPTEPTREALQREYEMRWRERAAEATIDGLLHLPPADLDHIPSRAALLILKLLSESVSRQLLYRMFQIDGNDSRADLDLQSALEDLAEQDLPAQIQYMLMMACAHDLHHTVNPLFEEMADLSGADLDTIQSEVQDEMKAEAAARAGKAAPTDKATPKLRKGKATAAEASRAIADAMAAAEVTTPNSIEPLQQVRIRVDLRGPGKKLLPTKGRLAVAIQPMGDRAWIVELPIDPEVDLLDEDALDAAERWNLSADYTELEIINTEAQETMP
ncbi:ParB/RepB/Spo0J family partition protein [Delftia sp. 60]|uniref:ParB/RepB/Spo0J family partition protein n=1 Tax=Delftia sp. 60 TaxID=2035216 RepID=UPI000C555E02|nr:ParB/RepB/Spo0J family partition protein [Delftia sp. 60]PIF38644.1 ParB/RepB/Spo0J family partition protein [Burkholderiales bacterium 23]PIF66177.1 ParB/RepB/Spo0J family partition protein [Delftia sp. 60]